MTGWAYVIMVAAVFLGLQQRIPVRRPYAIAVGLVVISVLYAALRQHTF